MAPDERAVDFDAGDTARFRRLVDDSVDELDRRLGLNGRERELALEVAQIVAGALPGLIRARPDNARLASLENWQRSLDEWRLKLTGVADGNGRLGRLDRHIEQLHAEVLALIDETRKALALDVAAIRRDLGTAEERKAERAAAATVTGVRGKLVATALTAALAIGSGGWAAYKATTAAKEAAARTAGRIEARLDAHDRALDWLFRGGPRPASPDPQRTP